MIEGLSFDVSTEDVLLNKVRYRSQLVLGVFPGRYGKDLVQFFQRERLGLGTEEKHEDEEDDVPAGVPKEGSTGCEGICKLEKGNRKESIEEPEDSSRVAHADLSNVQGVCLGTVGEWDWSEPWRIGHGVQVDAQEDNGDFGGTRGRSVEGAASHDEEDGEERRRKEEEGSSSKGVDGEKGRERKDKVQTVGR